MFIARAIERLADLSVPRRALALNALARALVYSDLSPEERQEAEHALIRALDDSSVVIRRAVADGLADHAAAPRVMIHLLANDQFAVAEPVLRRSPVLTDAQLVDLAASGSEDVQSAIANRSEVSVGVSAAIGEVCPPGPCLDLIRNPGATILEESLRRISDRHGHDQALRDELLARDDLPVDIRHGLVGHLGSALRHMVLARDWVAPTRIDQVIDDATEKATMVLLESHTPEDAAALLCHLHDSDRLTTQLLLRALCTGNIHALECGLDLLTGHGRGRVFAILTEGTAATVRALLQRAGLNAAAIPVFEVAIAVYRDLIGEISLEDRRRFRRLMIEQVLTRYEAMALENADHLMVLLHRFAADVARDDAKQPGPALARAA